MNKAIPFAAACIGLSAQSLGAQSIDDIRQQARSVCFMDAMTLCASSIPNEDAIMACMNHRRIELSAPCRHVFDAGMRATRRRHQSMR